MKRVKINKQAKVNNWLTHKETRDEIWDLMASRWALRAESITTYSKKHLPEPVKVVLRTTIKKPLESAKNYKLQRREAGEVVNKSLHLSSANK